MSDKPLAQQLAEYGHQLTFDALPSETVHEVKRRFIDSIATAVGAFEADAFHVAQRCAKRVSSESPATLFGGGQSSVEWATFVNGLLIRYLGLQRYLPLTGARSSQRQSLRRACGR